MTVPQAREDAAVLFTQRFGRQPRGAWRAPGRVNLIGEHTDYNEGFVLPFAIGAGLSAAAAQRDDGVLALASRQAPGDDLAVRLDALAPGSVSGWAAYPAGVAWALRDGGLPHRRGQHRHRLRHPARAPGCPPRPRWSARWRSP